MYVGRSPHVDPFLVTLLSSVRLPLHPRLKIHLVSRYSNDLVHEVMDGTLDLAIVNEPNESAATTQVKVDETPFYAAMSNQDSEAQYRALDLNRLDGRELVLFERRLHPVLHDLFLERLEHSGARASGVEYVTAPEEAFPLVLNQCVAVVVKAGALLLARNGVTVRPIQDDRFRLRTFLVSRADNDSRVLSELVRAFIRKLGQISGVKERFLPLFPS